MGRQVVKTVVGMLLSAVAMTVWVGSAGAGEKREVVLELFTSQGCSSCPPADALMMQLSTNRHVLALTFPVDYWDYLGWKDTFARPEFSKRQRDYASTRGDRAVYTPQMVVNGREHLVGSDRAAIEQAVARHHGNRTHGLEMDLTAAADVVVAKVGPAVAETERKATLWLVTFDVSRKVPIARGENKGRTVEYSNVVRQMQPIGMWKGKPLSIELPRSEVLKEPGIGVAIVLQVDQEGGVGPILGAAVLSGPSS